MKFEAAELSSQCPGDYKYDVHEYLPQSLADDREHEESLLRFSLKLKGVLRVHPVYQELHHLLEQGFVLFSGDFWLWIYIDQ